MGGARSLLGGKEEQGGELLFQADLGHYLELSGMLLGYVDVRTHDDKGTSRRVGEQEGGVGGTEKAGEAGWGGGGCQGASHSWLLPQPAPLYITPGHLLDKFVKDFLQPNQTFQDQIKKALKIICSFLEENCFRHSTTKIQVIQVSPGFFLCSLRGTK